MSIDSSACGVDGKSVLSSQVFSEIVLKVYFKKITEPSEVFF